MIINKIILDIDKYEKWLYNYNSNLWEIYMDQETINYTAGFLTARMYQLEKIQDMLKQQLYTFGTKLVISEANNNLDEIMNIEAQIDSIKSTLADITEQYDALEAELDKIIIIELERITSREYKTEKEVKSRIAQNKLDQERIAKEKNATAVQIAIEPSDKRYQHLEQKMERYRKMSELLTNERSRLEAQLASMKGQSTFGD